MKGKAKIGLLSLGCPRNLVDSESILGRLNFKNYSIVDMDEADIAIVNTCCFIEDAKRESIDAVLDLIELKKEGRLRKIIVYGCLPQRYAGALKKELPEVDAFVGKVSLNHESNRFSITPRHYAYLKICEGCVNNCSFCVIPKVKGGLSSLDIDSVLNKLEIFDKAGVSEVNIIGQDITGYGMDLYAVPKLAQMLGRISQKAEHIRWIRLLYLYPSRISDELLKVIRNSDKICRYIDIPIQHINDRILKLMNRKTSKTQILKLIEKIRRVVPGVALRTSVIAGFSSESDREFKELLDFLEEARFERLGAFIYSREEGTPAYNFRKQLPQKIKSERFDAVMSLQQKISKDINRGFLGKSIEVLIDEKGKDCYLGRSQYDAPEVDGLVYVNSNKALRPGEFVRAKITGVMEYDLVGSVEE